MVAFSLFTYEVKGSLMYDAEKKNLITNKYTP